MLGLTFRETLDGSWHRLSEPGNELRCVVDVTVVIPSVTELLGNTVAEISGRVTLEGLATDRAFAGTLGIGSALREKRVPYAFALIGDDGRSYRFDGAKEINVLSIPRSITTLGAYVFDSEGVEVGRVILRADLRDEVMQFLTTFRPTRTKK
ncbi:MAG: hypothetical protein Q8Q09_24785 [Deltaproteobacteria bacterium]|nr:hypothetical protein [Deltaproteobacteria bacterium]